MLKILLAAVLLAALPVLAQQPQSVPADQHNETVQAIISGRDQLTSQLQNEIAGLKVMLKRVADEAEKAKKAAEACKPEEKK